MTTAIKARPKIKIHPLEDRAVIRPAEEAESMRGPLYIPDTAKEKPTQGEVLAVGPGRMEEGVQILRGLLNGEKLTFQGKHNHLEGIQISPPPVQKNFPIWVGARADKAIDRAARLGFHFASVGVGHHRTKYLDALRRHGRNPADFNILQLVTCYCAETHEKAWNEIADGFHHVLKYYHDWAVASGDITGDVEGQMVPTPERFRKEQKGEFFGEPAFVGTPDEVCAGLQEYRGRSPSSHLVLYMSMPGNDPKNTRRSMELFARHVMPKLG